MSDNTVKRITQVSDKTGSLYPPFAMSKKLLVPIQKGSLDIQVLIHVPCKQKFQGGSNFGIISKAIQIAKIVFAKNTFSMDIMQFTI